MQPDFSTTGSTIEFGAGAFAQSSSGGGFSMDGYVAEVTTAAAVPGLTLPGSVAS